MGFYTNELITHRRRVQCLYKLALRHLESWYVDKAVYRYYAVLLRQRFDDNVQIKDRAVAEELYLKGQRELFLKGSPQLRRFWTSPLGSSHERTVIPPDWVLDYWHPLEKAEYATYFARREKRKQEFVKFWEENYNKYYPQYGPGKCTNSK